MFWNLLTAAADKTREFDNVGEASLYAILGFIVVCVGISFLIFVVWLVGKMMGKMNGANVKLKTQPIKKVDMPVNTSQEDEITDETVAVITAAILAYYQQNNPKCEFTVKRIKRI